MGRRYDGRDQAVMQEQIQRSRDYIDRELARQFPNHINWFHVVHRGNNYHFYAFRRNDRPTSLTVDLAVREVRDELFEIQHEGQDASIEFVMPDGFLAARVQIFRRRLELENLPAVQLIYNHLLYFGYEQPQFCNVIVVLE